jgi:enoyl-[acyl-carrier protein] reductase I
VTGLLAGKRALVCGVANQKSIAWGIAQALHQQGARLAFTCVESARRRVQKLAAELGDIPVVGCDVTSDEDVARAMREVSEAFAGKLDFLVHSIAYARLEDLGAEFISVSREGWKLALDVSAYSLVALAREARPLLIAAGGGSIITLTFAGGNRVVPSYNVMGVAKAALECSMRYLAYDLGPDHIRVNAVSPGPIATMSSMVVARFDEALENTRVLSPMLENVTPEDVGNAAVFFASDLSRRITGTIFYVDSGNDILSSGTKRHPRAESSAEVQSQ